MGAAAPTDTPHALPPATPPDPAGGIVASRASAAAHAIARVEPITTARALRGPFDYLLGEELRGRVGVGSMLVVPFGARKLLGVVVELAGSSEVRRERLLEPVRALEPGIPAELVELARWIAAEYCSTLARALNLVLPPGAARRLSGRKRRAAAPLRHREVGFSAARPPELGEDQRAALAPLLAALRDGRSPDAGAPASALLHGITGSGKTEVYLRAAEEALAQGRGAIVMVPEIALTPQILARFTARFPGTVAVLHSRMTPAQRYEQWRRLREGEARVCVGPRSAVFAPVAELGLIVVDEEHDASYKHEGDPRYDARDVAAERARRCGALLIAGSATPRPESVERMPVLMLPRRVDGRPLPPVEVLDMRGERGGGLHPVTSAALASVRERGGKAIVLLNRRGWSNFMSCRSCGRVWSCPECDVALVLHRAGGYLACHHCGHRERAPEDCPECRSRSVARHGAGTERLAHDLAAVLDDGGFPVFRLDADVLGSGASAEPGAVLADFEAARSGALIGTQMVAKGHDFPDVSLGVVLDADATLRFPDFRSEERTFALISQLAGRAGRGGEGRVLVQTLAPDARAIRHAARHDSPSFAAEELDRRRALGYPPFSNLIRIVLAAEQAAAARQAALELRERLLGTLGEGPAGAGVLGPAPLFRLRGRERQVIVIKAPERRAAVAAAGRAVASLAAERRHGGVSFSVDVDPQ
ncbi:MAG TPA: primosomal protein N' [Solirubrobacteraceae bacterium]|nr:primosomal protein N' [Solirubrobacteraceae bacterium]